MTSFPIGLFSPKILMLNKGQVKEILGRRERGRSLLKPQLSQKIVPPLTVGEDSGGKGEGDEIRNNPVNTQNHC